MNPSRRYRLFTASGNKTGVDVREERNPTEFPFKNRGGEFPSFKTV
jgi:hypothetical protein